MALENLGNKFKAFANVAVKKTGDAVEITKFNLNITSLQADCDELYRRIGVQVYTEITKGAVHSAESLELSRKISEKLYEIGQLREKIAEVKESGADQAPYTAPVDIKENQDTDDATMKDDSYLEVTDNTPKA